MKRRRIKDRKSRSSQKNLLSKISLIVIVLIILIIVGFIYFRTNFANGVLGTENKKSLTCSSCYDIYHKQSAIILQKNGKNSGNWGATCVPLTSLKSIQRQSNPYIICPIPTPTPKPKITTTPTIKPSPTGSTTSTGRIEVSVINQDNQFSNPPSGNSVNIYSGNSPTNFKLIAGIASDTQGWAGYMNEGSYSIIAYPQGYNVSFSTCNNCTLEKAVNTPSGPINGGVGFSTAIVPGQDFEVFVKFSK